MPTQCCLYRITSCPVTNTFKVTVAFNAGTTSVASYLFELTFDHTVVEVLDIEAWRRLTTSSQIVGVSYGEGALAAHNTAASTPATGLLTFANITFQVVGKFGRYICIGLRVPRGARRARSYWQHRLSIDRDDNYQRLGQSAIGIGSTGIPCKEHYLRHVSSGWSSPL